ncbi:MAG: S41 family peptidase, partial [Bryobacteraceae bacterium]
MPARRQSLFFIPLLITVGAILGGLAGPGILGTSAEAASGGPEDDVKTSLKSFTGIYELVEANFANKVDSSKAIYKGAIPGALRTLDPHSNFFDPKDFAALKEDQRGHYFGVGMTVGPRNGKTVVMAPFGGSPAYRAGLRPGDVIMEVNDKKCDNLTTSEIADLLKGPRGTHVQIMVAREGIDKPITFNIIRDEIPRDSVQVAFLVKPGIGYI